MDGVQQVQEDASVFNLYTINTVDKQHAAAGRGKLYQKLLQVAERHARGGGVLRPRAPPQTV
ncbi:hypothetical protein D3C71_1928830 [compost metagenome]